MKVSRFEEIVSWKLGEELTLRVYSLTDALRDFSFRDQMRRAAVSIMNNIAEGFERSSDKDFVRFLFMAKGSSAEVRSMLHLGLQLGYFTPEEYQECYALSVRISQTLSGFIRSLNRSTL